MSSQLHDPGKGRRSEPVPSDLVRPRYAPGLVLEDRDLTVGVDYARTLARLLFRSLLGCGVVAGLRVTVKTGDELSVTVDPGLALDGCGDPIQLVRPVTVTLSRADDVLAGRGNSRDAPKHPQLWVVLCGDEESYARRELVADADDLEGAAEPTRIRGTAQVAVLFERPKCLCPHVPPPTERTPAAAEPALDGGCGAGCDCGCCVLLARLEWSEGKEWRAIHEGERRFIRPMLVPDPVKGVPEPAAADASPRNSTSGTRR